MFRNILVLLVMVSGGINEPEGQQLTWMGEDNILLSIRLYKLSYSVVFRDQTKPRLIFIGNSMVSSAIMKTRMCQFFKDHQSGLIKLSNSSVGLVLYQVFENSRMRVFQN